MITLGKRGTYLLFIFIYLLIHVNAQLYDDAYYIEENINSFSGQEISDNAQSIKDLDLENRLTANQLQGNLEKFDPSKLNQQELSKAINSQYGTNHNFQNIPQGSNIKDGVLTSGGNTINLKELKGSHNVDFKDGKLLIDGKEFTQGKNIKSTGDGKGIQADSIASFNDGFIQIVNGINVKIYDDRITADYAETFVKGKSLSSNVNKLDAKSKSFSVESASSVLAGCNHFFSVDNSEFFLDNGNVKARVAKGETMDILDCNGKESTFESKSNEGEIKIDGNKYEIKEGILKCDFGSSSDKIIANNSASLEMGFDCFSCITINPIGSYWYSDEIVVKDFAINVPLESSSYKLCIERVDGQQLNEDYDGLINFPAKKITLNKIANYLRFPFIINDINTNDYTLLEPFNLVNVYESKHKNNKAIMNLDDDFLFINNLFIENNKPDVIGMVSYINNGDYAVYEYFNGNEVKRYGRFNSIRKPEVIKAYNSDFGNNNHKISFANGILKQEGINKYGTITQVKAVCDDCIQKSSFEQEMQDLSANNKIEKMCSA